MRTATARFALVFLALQFAAAAVFLWTYRDHSQDEAAGLRDIARYAERGVDRASLAEHVNAAGPLAFIVMAGAGRLVGDLHLGGRLTSLLGALVACALLYGIVRRSGAPPPVALSAAALYFVNPYAPLAAASLLTESFAIALLLGGLALWMHAIGRAQPLRWDWRLWLSGLLIGAAVLARQYYLAVCCGVWLATLITDLRGRSVPPAPSRIARHLAFGLVLLCPAALLVGVWGDLTPPLLRAGQSQPGWTAGIGLAPERPLAAIVAIGIYALPLAALVWERDLVGWRAVVAAVALAVATALAFGPGAVLCATSEPVLCGPVDGVFRHAAARGWGTAFYVAVAATAFLACFVAVAHLRRGAAPLEPVRLAAALSVAVFVAEQALVGGNIPFYERYVLQIWPLLILGVGWTCLPQRPAGRLAAALPFVIYGQWRLLRHFVS